MNAMQAVEEDGKIEIVCCRDGENASISVSDNGPGIKIEPKEKIFEPFLTTKMNGNGIGLWITKRLIDSLGGKIRLCENSKGETTFILLIPIDRKETRNEEPDHAC